MKNEKNEKKEKVIKDLMNDVEIGIERGSETFANMFQEKKKGK